MVPIDRALAHMYIETGGTGDPNIVSKGTNAPCPNPGKECSADLRAHGLFQIYWPPFTGVNWSKITDPDYNCYIGLKTLAYRKKQCGSWDGASLAFFAGSCVDIGTVDNSTGTSQAAYLKAVHTHMDELHQLGIGSGGFDGGSNGANPKPTPDNPPTNGDTNTPTETPNNCVSILGQQVCTPDVGSLVSDYITANFPRAVLVFVGILILFFGLRKVV